MEIYCDKADGDKVLELEDASTTINEVPNPVSISSIDEALCNNFLYFPASKTSLARTGIKSMLVEHVAIEKDRCSHVYGKTVTQM